MSLENSRWIEISVEADREAADDLLSLLSRYCQGGGAIEDMAPSSEGPLNRVIVKGFLPEEDQETLQKIEIALLLLGRTAGISEPRCRVLEPKDWAESWKAFFPPLPIGKRLVIVPTWVDYTPQPEQIIIHLDPGMAFGTGLHATTRLCLIAMEQLLQPGTAVLDVGTGSGILSIAAALLGASHVTALDTDPIAVSVAQENAALNGVADRITVQHGTLASANAPLNVPLYEGPPCDLVLANILAEVIIDMAPSFPRVMRPGAHCVASGILADKATAVQKALEKQGLRLQEMLEEDNWVALIATKPA